MKCHGRDEAARESHKAAHSPLCRLLTRLIKAAGGKNPLDRNLGAAIQLANIAKMILRNSDPHYHSLLISNMSYV